MKLQTNTSLLMDSTFPESFLLVRAIPSYMLPVDIALKTYHHKNILKNITAGKHSNLSSRVLDSPIIEF